MKKIPNKIVLMGYMASGKSKIGSALAKSVHKEYIDLDDFIAEKEKMNISKIFENRGEVYFRKKEIYYLQEILNREEGFILSVGGGTPTLHGAIEMINKLSFSVYLKASVHTLFNRLVPEKLERPLLTKIPNEILQDYIAIHLFERSNYYLKANLTISVDEKDVFSIVEELKEKLNYSR